jgi:nucleoside-diphosphate-sugar epimerase
MIVDNIENRGAVARAVQGMDVVIHLAAEPNDADFPVLVGPNVMGLFNVMDAARIAKLKRIVLASSIQVLSRRSRGNHPASVRDAYPGNHYGLTKLWAEKMGEMYARHYGLSVLAIRIAWLVRNQTEAMAMLRNPRPHLYLSAHDAGRFFLRAVEATDIDFAVVYAGSRGAEIAFDMEPAREVLGYVAQDTWPDGLDFELPALENQS